MRTSIAGALNSLNTSRNRNLESLRLSRSRPMLLLILRLYSLAYWLALAKRNETSNLNETLEANTPFCFAILISSNRTDKSY